jgi:hypothetical protein
MLNMYDKLSERNKGLVLLGSGIILLMSNLGITWFKPLIFLGSLILIGFGLMKLEIHKQVMNALNKK